MHSSTRTLAAMLAAGGNNRLHALHDLSVLLRTDAGRQIGEMTVAGWDRDKAAESYRQWLHDWADGVVDEFVERDQQ